jgi:predicted MFS family arabinose efflux permease
VNRAAEGASLLCVIVLGAVAVAGFNIQPMYLGALADHLGYSAEQLGVIAGLEVAGSALAGVAATAWVRRLDWRRVAFVALLALVGGNAVSAFVVDFPTMVVVRFLTGFFGVGTCYALSIAALGDTRATERNFGFAVVLQVGLAVVGFALLPAFIESGGAAVVFLALAGVALLLVPLTGLLPRGGRPDAAARPAAVASPLPISIWLALACQGVWYLGLGGVWAFVERIGVDAGLAGEDIGYALALGMTVGLLGAFASGAVADRLGRTGPFAVAMIGQVVSAVLLFSVDSTAGLVLAVCLYNGSWNFALPYIFSLASLADSGGRLIVLMSTAQAAGLTFGAMAAGAVVGGLGVGVVPWMGVLGALAALGMFVAAAASLTGGKRRPLTPASGAGD